MKKWKVIILLVLLSVFVSKKVFAEQFILECVSKSKVTKKTTKPLKRYLFRYIFDLKEKQYSEVGSKSAINLIVKDNELLEYNLSPAFGGGFGAQIIKWDRLNGERKAFYREMSIGEWRKFKTKLDKINSTINGYQRDLEWGDESYSVSNLGSYEQEIKKFKLIENYINLDEYALWQCNKAKKAF